MQRTHIALLVAALWGCADREIDLGTHQEEFHRANGDPISVSGCQRKDEALSERACVIDSAGTNYTLGDNMIVTSAAPPYGAYVEFYDGLELDPEQIVTEGADAPIKTYAAPYNLQGDPCCAETDPANRIASSASIALEGGLLIIVDEALAAGTQVSIDIPLARVFKPLAEDSEFDSGCVGGGLDCLGFGFRFYVGEEPAVVDTSQTGFAELPLESGR